VSNILAAYKEAE